MSAFGTKDAAEIITVTFPFAEELGTATIDSAVVTVTVHTGTDADVGTMLQGSPSVQGMHVLHLIKNGVAGVDYMVRCLATLSDGRKLLRAEILPVRLGGV